MPPRELMLGNLFEGAGLPFAEECLFPPVGFKGIYYYWTYFLIFSRGHIRKWMWRKGTWKLFVCDLAIKPRVDGYGRIPAIGSTPLKFWPRVKTQNQWYHFGVGESTTDFRTYFSGDWDVHWGYGILTGH